MHFRFPLLLSLSCIAVFFASCGEEQGAPVELGYDYFPMEFGRYVSYNVDSISFDAAVGDTFSYQIKERIDSLFIDTEGRDAALLHRFYRASENDNWVLRDVWTQTRTNSRAERYEEDVRYTRLAFPTSTDQVWDGNAFNSFDEWEHRYEGIDIAREVDGISYEHTLRVLQRENSNLARFEEAEEIYAKEIGMIYKRLDTFKTVFPSPVDPDRGVKFEMRAFDFGTE